MLCYSHTDSDIEGNVDAKTSKENSSNRNRTKSRTRRKPKVKVISSTPLPESSDPTAKVDDVKVACSMEPTKQQGKILIEFSTSDVDPEEICREFVS